MKKQRLEATASLNEPEALPNVILRHVDLDRIIAGHPWVYASQIAKAPVGLEPGALVCVRDPRRRFIGVGFYNPNSQIRVRLVSRQRVETDQTFFEFRLTEALEFRKRYCGDLDAFRWVNSEGDYLSGLIVDVYGPVCVLQTPGLGMDRRKDLIVAAIRRIMNPKAIVERNDFQAREFEGLTLIKQIICGEISGPIEISLNGVRFLVDVLNGQKTGWYLDQQSNCKLIAELARIRPGMRVLDSFCYTGALGLQAAVHGRACVDFVDQSQTALELAERNAELNGVRERCRFFCANAFDWLRAESSKQGPARIEYDLIILDPPSFTRNKEAIPEALRGYKEIHIRALRLLKRGGLLVTFSCSHHVDRELFLSAIVGAAADTETLMRQVAVLGQAPDHTIMPMVPETEYLKGFVFEKM